MVIQAAFTAVASVIAPFFRAVGYVNITKDLQKHMTDKKQMFAPPDQSNDM